LVTTYSPADDGAGTPAEAEGDETNEFDTDDEMARVPGRDGDGYDGYGVCLSVAFSATGRFLPPREATPVMIPSSQFARMFTTLAAPRLVACPLILAWYLISIISFGRLCIKVKVSKSE